MTLQTLKKLKLKGKRVLYRVDLNVPITQGKVSDLTRITRLIPSIRYMQEQGAKIVMISHFGRPKGHFVRDLSLAPITNAISEVLDNELIHFALDCVGDSVNEKINNLKNGEIILLENLRFHKGEENNNTLFAKSLAELGDIYVNDTFSCSHRKHASLEALPKLLPSAAGFLLEDEIANIERILGKPQLPMITIVGGSKVSTKLNLLQTLVKKSDIIVVGGAMANTFLKAQGFEIGKSLHENELVDSAKDIIQQAAKAECELILPADVIVAKSLEAHTACQVLPTNRVAKDDLIVDIGPKSVEMIAKRLNQCKTVSWNGPLGAFEVKPFNVGSISIARHIASLTTAGRITSIAGGGDVVATITESGLTDSFTYISTAGGAFLQWLEGNELPALVPLAA